MTRTTLAVTALVLAVAAAAPVRAADDGFAAFWSKFALAAGKDDKAALAAMTTLGPALENNDVPVTFAKVDAIFLGPAARRCLAKAKPQRDINGLGAVEYDVLCRQVIYVFSKTGAAWSWTDTGPDD
jgi:hypothetical protein